MANEAVIVELLGNQGDPIEITVADGTGIPKGTLMKMTGDRTGEASTADGNAFMGITTSEKVANDGSTTLAVYTHAIFDLTDAGAGIGFGNRVTIGGANTIKTAAAGEAETGEVFGLALETASAGEVIQVLVGGY